MSNRDRDEMPIAEDCFLDLIADLLGVVIVLVVIVGARSHASAKVEVADRIRNETELLDTPVSRAKQLDLDLQQQAKELQQYEYEIAMRDAERMMIVDRVTVAEQIAEQELQKVDSSQREDLSTDFEMSELQKQLADLLKQQGDVQALEQTTAVLQHLPTPMAKTVFGRELHVVMRDGNVSVIPWERLITTLKSEVRHTVERNSQKNRMVNQLGPIDGFMMTYSLKSQSGVFSDGRSTRLGKSVELEKFELDPTPEVVRETADQSLAAGGRLRVELAANSSKQTTVTVWVYPDSFEQFRNLKERLFMEGYLCAARPLPFNVRVGASPRGSSSTAQ